jgi:formylglycine-generating enzyme required for sulfatase activity
MVEEVLKMVYSWVKVSGGQVTLEAGGYLREDSTFEVASFVMSRYPVTNEQYGQFIDDGGYTNRAWWTEDGWAAKGKQDWRESCYWQNNEWNQPDRPVVGVSWYEAVAFCRWLSASIQQTVLLPTEQQWQRAAQGDDGRDYPWGDEEPTRSRCNWNRYQDETSPVTQYPDGSSPFGIMDMSGNVWEWCLTSWDSGFTTLDGYEARILRGGSWSSDSPLSLRTAHRSPRDPNTRLNPSYRTHVTVGFRCVCQDDHIVAMSTNRA